MRLFAAICLGILLAASTAFAAEDLTVLESRPGEPAPGSMLEVWLQKQAYAALDRRAEAFEKLQGEADSRRWQAERRAFFLERIGGLPERTPLNPRVVGRLEGDGYRVEKILFESRPAFHVSANLYLPAGPGPWPGVIVPCGHSADGKAAGAYQRICILLARNGMAALCYDPIGQGERYQMLDPTREWTHFETPPHMPVPHPHVRCTCTDEHTMMGLGCILLGSNVAQYRIWDGMRAIDYLQSRGDIRADRIGCTGNSGGGTLTAYLTALDDRIVAAASVCALTTFRRLIATAGPQDAEQNIFGQIAFGLDQADYLALAAPRPTLVCAGTRDATFDIRGTWDLVREAKRFYSRLRCAERVEMHEADAPHGYGIQQREAAARWLHRWLLGSDKVIVEVAELPDPLTDERSQELSRGEWTGRDLQCTPSGQVLLMPGERSVFQINAEAAARLRAARAEAWTRRTPEEKRRLVRETIGYLPIDRAAKSQEVGRVDRDGYTIRKLVLEVEPGLRLPALLFVPAKADNAATLYLHGTSMQADAAPGGPIEELVRQGQTVLAAELRGIGETETGHAKKAWGRIRFGDDIQEVLLAYLLGRSYVGMRVEDVFSWAAVLEGCRAADGSPPALHVVGIGEAAIPVLHAAALEPHRFHTVALRHRLPSWEALVAAAESRNQAVNVVHGALLGYDLADLIDLAGPAKLRESEAADPMGGP